MVPPHMGPWATKRQRLRDTGTAEGSDGSHVQCMAATYAGDRDKTAAVAKAVMVCLLRRELHKDPTHTRATLRPVCSQYACMIFWVECERHFADVCVDAEAPADELRRLLPVLKRFTFIFRQHRSGQDLCWARCE